MAQLFDAAIFDEAVFDAGVPAEGLFDCALFDPAIFDCPAPFVWMNGMIRFFLLELNRMLEADLER